MCATYPSTTVVPSTVLVSPTPWTDQAANSGTPFVLRIQQVDSSGWTKRQAEPSWLMYNGNTTTNGSVAEQYHINNGQLLTSNGSYVSTDFQVLNQALAASDYIEPINTTFSVADGMLNWTNPTFSNGTAQFYKLPPGLLDNALILVKFLGPMQPARSWSPIVLYADPGKSLLANSYIPN
ncbi:hypothetical protein H2203_002789 [Taxawa tesnikishii (nom. ined.)]|nr:hypothetical protein H2203_002789 [Dothideales sp. JES 119]